jgi:hypothetical protein
MAESMEGFTDGAVSTEVRDADQESSRQEMRNVISLGMDMENFLRSDVGRYLSACAEVGIKEFRSKLDDLDPEDSKNIRDIQQEIAVRKIWKDWIGAAINEGVAAQESAIERNSL